MRREFLCHSAAVVLVLAAGPAVARAQDHCGERNPDPGLLVSAEWLQRHRSDSDLVILQVERSRAPYDSAHVPGARFIAMSDFTTKRGDILTELPPVAELQSRFESLGIGNRGRIVLYGETLPVTRLFFTLDYLGLGDRVSVLDGGIGAWTAARGELATAETGPAGRKTLSVHPRPELVADAAYVNAHRKSKSVLLLDTRSREEYDGAKVEEGVARPGHIPGAVSFDWTTTIADGRFRDRGELRRLFTAAGATSGKEVVTYCRVGTRASAVYFAARLLGYRVRLYDGSMNEWAGRAELPVVGKTDKRKDGKTEGRRDGKAR
jgi:thiosulfate/3-mercaptopyruvate sulfurtransferase